MIDWSRVRELRDEIGDDTFAEVVDLFLEEVDQAISGLRTGQNTEPTHEVMHFLKGCALNLGFSEFGKLCLRTEKAAEAGKTDAVDIPAILICYDASRSEFLRKLRPQAIRSQIRPVFGHS